MILRFKKHKGIKMDKLSYKEREKIEKEETKGDKIKITIEAEIGKDGSLTISAERDNGEQKLTMSKPEIAALLMLTSVTVDSDDEYFQKEYIKHLNEMKSITF